MRIILKEWEKTSIDYLCEFLVYLPSIAHLRLVTCRSLSKLVLGSRYSLASTFFIHNSAKCLSASVN